MRSLKTCGSTKIPTYNSSRQTLDNFWTNFGQISDKFRTNFCRTEVIRRRNRSQTRKSKNYFSSFLLISFPALLHLSNDVPSFHFISFEGEKVNWMVSVLSKKWDVILKAPLFQFSYITYRHKSIDTFIVGRISTY